MIRRVPMLLAGGAAIALTLSGCGFTGLYNASLPGGADLGDHPFTVTAYFSDVLDLVPQSAVKVDDVPVGKVTDISLGECANPSGGTTKVWCAKVTMQVNDSVNLPPNAAAEVLQTSLLGEKYVALQLPQGQAASGRLGNGAQIPLAVTQSAPETEDVLGALSLVLNEGGLSQIRIIASELNKALGSSNQQAAARDLITQLSSFTGALNTQRDKITAALASVNALAATLADQKSVIAGALDTFPAALQVLSQQRSQLVSLLSSLSNFGSVATNVINASQSELVGALKALKTPVDQLTAAGNNLVGALRIGGTFPFPLGLSNQFVKGDYANLSADVTLNVTTIIQSLCDQLQLPGQSSAASSVIQQSCTTLNGLLSSLSSSSQKIAGSSAADAKVDDTTPQIPTLIGSGS